MKFIIDASPMLNFLATGEQNSLVQTARQQGATLCVPEQVDIEISGQASASPRFSRSGAAGRWAKLRTSVHIAVLDDDVSENAALSRELTLISGWPAANRVRSARDLGEDMVIAHGCVLAQQGHVAYLLIDERRGRAAASRARQRLQAGNCPGSLRLISTRTVLESARPEWFQPRHRSWQQLYEEMKRYDDGL